MIDVFCDGSTINANPSTLGGAFAWCHVVAGERIVEAMGIIPIGWCGLSAITNNVAELVAAVEAVEALPSGMPCVLYSDSQVTLRRFNYGKGWKGVPDPLRWRVEAIRDRVYRVRVLAGHPTRKQLVNGRGRKGMLVSVHNYWADRLAGECGVSYAGYLRVNAATLP